MAGDKKENFRMNIVLVFAAIQYAVLKFTCHQCFTNAEL